MFGYDKQPVLQLLILLDNDRCKIRSLFGCCTNQLWVDSSFSTR